VSEKLGPKNPSGTNPYWLALALVVFALMTLTVGLVAGGKVREPYATPFFHLFFRDVLQMKAWLVTAAVVLACGQLLTAARIYERLRLSAQGAVLSRCPLLVRAGGDSADAAGGLPLYFPAWIRRQQPARPDSLVARVGPLRRCRRQGARGSIGPVCDLGAPRGRRSPLLDPPGAVADFGARVLYRGSPVHVSDGA
jgi:hypothetical protein